MVKSLFWCDREVVESLATEPKISVTDTEPEILRSAPASHHSFWHPTGHRPLPRDLGAFHELNEKYGSISESAARTKSMVPCLPLGAKMNLPQVEPGKFIRKCKKTKQIFKYCVERPSKVVRSNQECTEEDVVELVVKRSLSRGIGCFFEAAKEIKMGYIVNVFGDPHYYNGILR
ncbi:hypothetical protein LguiB_009737 [Lonicera macranthoides]